MTNYRDVAQDAEGGGRIECEATRISQSSLQLIDLSLGDLDHQRVTFVLLCRAFCQHKLDARHALPHLRKPNALVPVNVVHERYKQAGHALCRDAWG
jgi:hypothetical protein